MRSNAVLLFLSRTRKARATLLRDGYLAKERQIHFDGFGARERQTSEYLTSRRVDAYFELNPCEEGLCSISTNMHLDFCLSARFIKFRLHNEAAKALEELAGAEVLGRVMRLSKAAAR